jgi:Ca2+-binding RTX toxin-like protein
MVTINATSSSGTGIQYNLTSLDDIYVGANATIVSTDSDAIFGETADQHAIVAGNVHGLSNGIALGFSTTSSDIRVTVLTSGLVTSINGAAISIQGRSSEVTNSGMVSGVQGIAFTGTSSGTSRIMNYGTIIGEADGIFRGAASTNAMTILNTGLIQAGNGSGDFSFDAGGSSAAVSIRNAGMMIGGISFGTGADRYVGLDGWLEGGISFGSGNDVLDGRGARITGGIDGGAGNDTLTGTGGADTLTGGEGADRIAGGGGNDVFVFASPNNGADVITDFGSKAGNNDLIQIDASAFGAGLVAGALAAGRFHSGTARNAQDAGDRFIFRTTDATLWFDEDGKGGDPSVLIADLQAGSVVRVGDFLLI